MRAARTGRCACARRRGGRRAGLSLIATGRDLPIIIAGAGIGGLAAALALARRGFSVLLLEGASELEEIGAGIQLSPNATRILDELGVLEALRLKAVAVAAVRIMDGMSGRVLARMPLGDAAQSRHGAPYLALHRADLQRALYDATSANPSVTLRLGVTLAEIARDGQGVAVAGRMASGIRLGERGRALIGADGLWSRVRDRLGHPPARFRHAAAWRALVPAEWVAAEFRSPEAGLWLGAGAHLVHYPVRGGTAVNIVAVVSERDALPGWNAPISRAHVLARFKPFAPVLQSPIAAAESWHGWSLHDVPTLPSWGDGPVTLLGDAAHAALPFLAQGAAMAIEDAAVLAASVAASPDDLAGAFRAYERERRSRTARVAQSSARLGRVYALPRPLASFRNAALRWMGGDRLAARNDWLYGWRAPE